MPSVNFKVIWPDGDQVTYYSPSTIVHEHLTAGTGYSQSEFNERIHTALNAASERVYKRFGYYCTAASAELEKINQKLQFLREQNIAGEVQVTQLG
jgi:uncharacterized repeat protein (TIGR04042 family)